MTSESSEVGEEESSGGATPVAGMNQAATPSAAPGAPTQAAPQAGGRRTQLKIVRENIDSLSRNVGNFRKSHEASIKKLEKQVAVLRSELAAQSISKDLASFRKSHDTGTKQLEKQVATLRAEVATLKASIAKDAARGRAKNEAMMAKILAKVSIKPRKPAKIQK